MKERGILFGPPMVIANLEDRKNQTRRIVDPQPEVSELGNLMGEWLSKPLGGLLCPKLQDITMHCPYGKAGDRLWVREAWRADASLDHLNGTQIAKAAIEAGYSAPWAPIQYEADGVRRDWVHMFSGIDTTPGRYRHARFMPRWASRILLEITNVRVERLQDISEEDAIAEGAEWAACGAPQIGSHKAGYAQLWESINGAGSWEQNPWVWVISFKMMATKKGEA